MRKHERYGPATEKIPSHVNIVFASLDALPEQSQVSYPDRIVSFSVPTGIEIPGLDRVPLQAEKSPTWADLGSIN
jgi:hypothetical protein